jgi:hypothetical protein
MNGTKLPGWRFVRALRIIVTPALDDETALMTGIKACRYAFDVCETALALIAIKSSLRFRIIVPMTGAYFVFVN